MSSSSFSQRRILITIMILTVFSSFGNPLVIPLFPYIMGNFQITPVQTTLLITMYALPGIFIIPILGFLEDRLGRRLVMISSLLICIVSSFGMGSAQSYGVMLFWRVWQGLAVTPLEALCSTLISDNFEDPARTRHLSQNTSVLFMGVAAFPIISLASNFLLGWRFALMVPGFLGICILLLCWNLPMRYHPSAFQLLEYFTNLKKGLLSRTMLSLFGIRILSVLIMFSCIHSYLPFLITEKMGAPSEWTAWSLFLFSIFVSFGSVCLGQLMKRFTLAVIGVSAALMISVGLLGLASMPVILALLIPLILLGIGSGVLQALTLALVAQHTTPNTRGTVLAIYSTTFRMAQAIAPTFGSMLYLKGSFSLLYGVSASAGLAMAVFICRTMLTLQKKLPKTNGG